MSAPVSTLSAVARPVRTRARKPVGLPAEQVLTVEGPRRRTQVLSLSAAATMSFEDFRPVRGISSYEGQAHLTGVYFFGDRHVPYRSVLHREALRILDFLGEVAVLCAFPFYVHPAPGEPGRAPDYLAKLKDGSLRVIDVRRRSTANSVSTQRELGPTRDACRQMGWRYRLVTEPNEQFHANVTWLSQYRCEPIDHRVHREAILEACATGATVDELLAVAANSALTLAVIFHMLWRRDLRVPLEQAIRHDSVLVAAPGARA